MTNEQKRQIAEEIAQALRRSLKERSIGGLKSFLKDLAHRQTQAANQTLSGVAAPPPLISDANRENIKHGYYVLSEEEKKILAFNRGYLSLIWDKLKTYNLSNNKVAREAAGLDPMKQDPILEAGRVFVATEEAIEDYIQASKIVLESDVIFFNPIAKKRLAIILLYANFLNGEKINESIRVNSTFRFPKTQYEDMKVYLERVYDPDTSEYNSLYRNEIDKEYKRIRDSIAKTKSPTPKQSEDISREMISFIERASIEQGFFPHCRSDICVADISPSYGMGLHPYFIKALKDFRSKGIFLNPIGHTSPTLLYKEGSGGGEDAHHLLFTGLARD